MMIKAEINCDPILPNLECEVKNEERSDPRTRKIVRRETNQEPSSLSNGMGEDSLR